MSAFVHDPRRRRAPNRTEKLAAVLLEIKRGSEWLIPEPLRSFGDAKAICAHVDFHHNIPHAIGGDTRPQNMTPLPGSDHDEETRKRTIPEVAKTKRIERKYQGHKAKVAAKLGNVIYEPPHRNKRPFPGSRASGIRKHMNGMVSKR